VSPLKNTPFRPISASGSPAMAGLILKILHVFLRLKFSPFLNSNEIRAFFKGLKVSSYVCNHFLKINIDCAEFGMSASIGHMGCIGLTGIFFSNISFLRSENSSPQFVWALMLACVVNASRRSYAVQH